MCEVAEVAWEEYLDVSDEVSLGVLRDGGAPVEREAPVGRHRGLHPQPLHRQALDEIESTAENHLIAETLQLRAQAGERELLSSDFLHRDRGRDFWYGNKKICEGIFDMICTKVGHVWREERISLCVHSYPERKFD